ncbi:MULTISPECIES: sugar transferase [Cyanophyceae]|uniref:sugar transferase n=1 Tax=unclassified Leptolyngbya TaxID=2650499 RepID=UPI00168A01B1|nr:MULTISPECIES: sugar transferase [Cyanophyceae]MBD1915985.1 sugar transferase [Phormidium sp. FACHB-77]MBD2030341.1 sugar transferase [Phormidium sp. FACHB-322]MBD2053343.1 sugar transferase [Leptolyngbya sp. FACHB-60]
MLSLHTDSSGGASPETSISIAHPSVRCLIKRSIDILGALIGLAILVLVALPVALAIRLDSPGPIFYAQTRYGLKGKPFTIWKFRSMVPNADALKQTVSNQAQGLIFKNENDPRITRVGRVLRKTSLDEFPQFWNVLKGDMSLVGTRPPTADEVSRYSPHHWRRLDVKPGITGQWQVSGRSAIKDFEEIVHLDLQYQAIWSPWYDLQVILKTVTVLLDRKGAF